MHIALSVEEGKRYGPALQRAKQPRGLRFGKPYCSVKSTRQTRKVIPEGVSQKKKKKKSAVQVFSFTVSLGNFFSTRSDQMKSRWWDLWDQILVPALPCSQPLTEWIMCPLFWGNHLFALPPPWKKGKKIMFYHWFSHMKLISSPFSGSEAAVSNKSAISLCIVSVSAGEILNSLCTKLFLNFILFWNFASLGLGHTGHPIWLWQPSTVWAGSVLIF